MNDIVSGREFIEPQPAVTPVSPALVIRQYCPDDMAIKRVRPLTFRRADMAAEHEEQIRIAL